MPCIPENYQFPSCKVFDLWNIWWDGVNSAGIGPVRMLRSWDFKRPSDVTKLSKARKVIQNIIDLSPNNDFEISKLNISSRDELFQKHYLELCVKLFNTPEALLIQNRQYRESSYVTLYDMISNMSRKKK
jgi:hypothetical protein